MSRAEESAPRPPSDEVPHQANPVLRLVRGPTGHAWNFLCCGIDALDLGLTVVHTSESNRFINKLLALQQLARESRKEVEFPDPEFPGKVYRTGGKPMYQLHLKADGLGELYFRMGEPIAGTPDIFVSFASKDLWLSGGIDKIVLKLCAWLNEQGFLVHQAKPSRCDVCMDILVPGGISQDLLDRFICTDAQRNQCIRDRYKLEGYCLGSRKGGIYARIYDKTKEINDQSHKWWFWDIWQQELRKDVWRVEFELKRDFFRSLHPRCNDVGDLLKRLPDFWQHLTATYLTFRADNGKRTGRREILPISTAMAATGRALLGGVGEHTPIDRHRGRHGSWEHAKRDLRRLAVRAGALACVDDLSQAVDRLQADLLQDFDRDGFVSEVRRKRREFGLGSQPASDAQSGAQP